MRMSRRMSRCPRVSEVSHGSKPQDGGNDGTEMVLGTLFILGAVGFVLFAMFFGH